MFFGVSAYMGGGAENLRGQDSKCIGRRRSMKGKTSRVLYNIHRTNSKLKLKNACFQVLMSGRWFM